MKQIITKISNCEECPFLGYDDFFEERICTRLNKLLYFEDFNDIFEGSPAKPIIYKNCPLEDFKNDKDK